MRSSMRLLAFAGFYILPHAEPVSAASEHAHGCAVNASEDAETCAESDAPALLQRTAPGWAATAGSDVGPPPCPSNKSDTSAAPAPAIDNSLGGTKCSPLQVVFMRHAEGTHQTHFICKVNFDPELTLDGTSQAVGAKECLKLRDSWDLAATGWNKRPAFPDAIFSSFLVRSIQTANYAFEFRDKTTPLGGIKIADYISEVGFQWQHSTCTHSTSCPWSPKKQFDDCVGTGRRRTGRCSGMCCGPNICGSWPEAQCSDYLKSKLDWSWLGLSGTPPDSYKAAYDDSKSHIHKPNWHTFLAWLWSKEPIRGLVRNGGGLIGFVSHGDFMKDEILPPDFEHPDNVEIYRGNLEVECDAGGAAGFKMQKPTSVEIISCRRRESSRRRS